MAQISDRSPHQGCKRDSKEAAIMTRREGEGASTLTQTLNGPGGKMAVAWPAPCLIAAEMAHDWLGWNGVILGLCYNEMNRWWDAPYNQEKKGSHQPVLEVIFKHGTKSYSLGASGVFTLRVLSHRCNNTCLNKVRGGKNSTAVIIK